jgi:hypothetical protein
VEEDAGQEFENRGDCLVYVACLCREMAHPAKDMKMLEKKWWREGNHDEVK